MKSFIEVNMNFPGNAMTAVVFGEIATK